MKNELDSIDLSKVTALKSIADEREQIQVRLQAMAEQKAKVDPIVFKRVEDDYRQKVNALSEKSAPLLQEVRVQYQQLSRALATLESASQTVRLDKQEAELRHQLGELDRATFDKRLRQIDSSAADKLALLKQAQELKAIFLQSVQAESELMEAASQGQPTNKIPSAAAERFGKRSDQAEAAPPSATVVMPAIDIPDPDPTTGRQPIASTQVFRTGRLSPLNSEAGSQVVNLGVTTVTMGTSVECDTRLSGPGIDPRHAEISCTATGYILKDLGSEHGTRVNAAKIAEQLLVHEDVIQIGAARFVFRKS